MAAVRLATLAAVLVGMAPADALAYIGPGAGLSAFGALLALIVSLIVAIVGFVWYPIKRFTRSLKRKRAAREPVSANVATGSRP